MQSLRKKRQASVPAARPRANTLKRDNDARKSRVDDKIKKRMSTRYADMPEPAGIPDVPALPIRAIRTAHDVENIYNYGQRNTRLSTTLVDIAAMQQMDFDPEAYLKTTLANSTEAELKNLQSSLESAKAEASTDLQRNVFQNYEEFVLISKEISTLENDMLELKEGLSEWKSLPTLLSIEDTASSLIDRRRANRSSVADLAKLYATQISTLHTTIEGSSKFVPAIPGRHIILEIESSWSLNAATYKVEYAVHFVLLDDLLLVAKRRKRRTGEGGKLVAEKCWPINEISLLDMKDTQDVSRAFRFRRGKESFVYRCDRSSDKKALFASFKTTAEELAARKRKEREGEHERRRSLWAAGDRMSLYGGVDSVPVPPIPNVLAPPDAGSSTEKSELDAKWIGDFTDDLSVAIALRKWDEAIGLVDKGRSRLGSLPALGPKLSPLTSSLTTSLLHALSDTSLRKAGVVHVTSLLLRLNQGTAAREAFLAARTELIRKRIRMIGFEGEISVYVSELALVIFTSIKHTADWYLASFKENDMASGLVQWVKEQIEVFANMFRRQVYGSPVDEKDVEDSLQAMRTQSKRLLHDNGMDFAYLLEELVSPPPSSAITNKGALASKTSVPSLSISLKPPSSRFDIEVSTPTPVSPRRMATPIRSPGPSSPSPALANLASSSPSSPGPTSQGLRPRPPRSAAPPRPVAQLPPRSRDRPPSALG